MNVESLAVVAGTGLALYAGHHVGDYWVQTDHQARHKGAAGVEGRVQCLLHVGSYLVTQMVMLLLLAGVTGWRISIPALVLALAVSGGTHYAADRREHGLMFWLARRLPGKAAFLRLGVPRNLHVLGDSAGPNKAGEIGRFMPGSIIPVDNPSLGTGAWALDQSWHLFFGVFIPALIFGAFS